MTDFEEAYKALNKAQRQAVDTIDGPVLVVAGPGTGKTQLLGMRAAQIVRKTDTAPGNILCLTFTESAALNMRRRLISLMGAEGNKIAVHTFHSFGTEIINQNPEYFYNGARFSPADDMTSYEILNDIFTDLPHSSPLAKTMNGEFTALKDVQAAISHLKRAGLTPEELLAVLDHNDTFCDKAEKPITAAFATRLSKKDIPKIKLLTPQFSTLQGTTLQIYGYKSLGEVFGLSLEKAVDDAEAAGRTTPLTAWRNQWFEKNGVGELVFKDRAQGKKLRALVGIYQKYREKLLEQELFDFDDMVSLVAHTLETTPELRLNLQEQYLYLMVDEFQDTNGAQLRLLNALGENKVNEGRPNILVVGDDDQAIYAFQGAELNHIIGFAGRYRDPAIITLTDNYRSTAPILQHARQVITQGQERLETALTSISKELVAHTKTSDTSVELHQFTTAEAEYQWISEQAASLIKKGVPPSEIAVLARNHRQLIELLPHLHANDLSVRYERRSNVLESQHIRELITLAETVLSLSEQRFDIVDSLLPELLSYEFWGLKTSDLWQLSLKAYKEHRMWLELMIDGDGKLRIIAEFLIVASHKAQHEPLELMLDMLIGSTEQQVPSSDTTEPVGENASIQREEFTSPYRAHYFNERRLQQNPAEYLALLDGLRAIRQALANYHPEEMPNLRSFIDFIDLHERTGTPIVATADHTEADASISLMTAHKAKGLEFNSVFVLSCQDNIWGRSARRPGSSLRFPHNLPIEPTGKDYDDALRLFFVAATRAKQRLYMSCHARGSNGKESLLAEFLNTSELAPTVHDTSRPANLEQLTPGWELRYLSLPKIKQEVLLRPTLEAYKLSATHLNNFIDIVSGGPQAFLLQNLLRFPQAITQHQAFGQAIHAVLQRAHTHLSATGDRRPIEDILHDFEIHLQQAHLSEQTTDYLLEKGSDVLQNYLKERYSHFNPQQKAERNFANQNVAIGGMRLTGMIDVMHVDTALKLITVLDYKTGKALSSWRGATDLDKIKLHKYKQQLMFYKLLVEHSREFSSYTVEKGVLEFVECDAHSRLCQLEMTFEPNEMTNFTALLQAVWRRIMTLNFPDTSNYPPTYKGVLAFEDDLLRKGD